MKDQDKLAWCMFYSAVQGWQYHPGNHGIKQLTTSTCAKIADDMLAQYLQRELTQWDGWQPHKLGPVSQTHGSDHRRHTKPIEPTSNYSGSSKSGKNP